MTIQINETATLTANPTTESKSSGSRYRAKVIQAGQGSSAYYPATVLEEYASVFQAGTHVYFDHPSAFEDENRPERSVKDLVGKLVTEASFEGDALYADVEFYSWAAPVIAEMKDSIGLSIRAFGTATEEADTGQTLTSFVDVASVDVVTRAGAGGALLEMLESARPPHKQSELTDEQITKNKEKSMSEAIEAKIDSLMESFKVVTDLLTPIAESLTASGEEEEATLDPMEAATALANSELSESGRSAAMARVIAGTELTEAITAQKEYEDSLRESVRGLHVNQETEKPKRVSGFKKVGA